MTVWVFGGSYTNAYGFPDQWFEKVASLMGTNAVSLGLRGSSLDYTYKKFNDIRHQIKENDVVIVSVTSHVKRWFFKYHPEHTISPHPNNKGTNYEFVMLSPSGNPKETDALNAYSEHLNNTEVYDDYSYNFLYNLEYLTKKLNLHTIVLIGYYDTERWFEGKKELFPLLKFSTGKLLDISLDEYSKKYLTNINSTITDKRVNHLTRSNHLILADKIVDNIKNKTPLDLTKGFTKHLISDESLNDPEFVRYELFGGIEFKK